MQLDSQKSEAIFQDFQRSELNFLNYVPALSTLKSCSLHGTSLPNGSLYGNRINLQLTNKPALSRTLQTNTIPRNKEC